MMLVFWLVGAGLALYSLRTRGTLYQLFLTIGLLATAGSGFASLTLGVGWIAITGAPLELRGVGLLLASGVVIGGWLVLMLATEGRVPGWLISLLPVRGIYARRLLATVALIGIVGPSVGVLSLIFASFTLPGGSILSIGLLSMVFVGYFVPLWDVLVRG